MNAVAKFGAAMAANSWAAPQSGGQSGTAPPDFKALLVELPAAAPPRLEEAHALPKPFAASRDLGQPPYAGIATAPAGGPEQRTLSPNPPDAPAAVEPSYAFEFKELGVFGRHAAQPWLAAPMPGALRGAEAGATQFVGKFDPRNPAFEAGPATRVAAGPVSEFADGTFEPPATVARTVVIPEATEPAIAVAPEASVLPDDFAMTAEPASQSAPVPFQHPLPVPAAPPAALAVTVVGTMLSVVARGAVEPDANAADIRRMLEHVAAEFGMSVSELQLNGAAIEPPSSAIGGGHGHRTR